MVKLSLATSKLAEILGLEFSGQDVKITGVALSAQEVEPGDLFVAVGGAKHHGMDFLDQAVARGAAAVLSDKQSDRLPSLLASDPKSLIGQVCNLVLGECSLQLYAVTGTNGKTSTSTYLYQLLQKLGQKPGLSGSTGMYCEDFSATSALTTAELTTTRKFLSRVEGLGGKAAALEVSAQALVRNRVAGLKFLVAGFTNLTRDHLDDFGSMEDYFIAKARLFDPSRASSAVIFCADSWAEKLADQVSIPTLLIGPGKDIDYNYSNGVLRLDGKLRLIVPFEYGELMARNFALALAMLFAAGYSEQQLQAAATGIGQVPGRLELVSQVKPHTYVDYAHTPDGISSAIAELNSRYPGVTVVFGASGNRDIGKRAQMGAAAASANQVVVTDQHPRDEDPALIRAAVISGLAAQGKTFREISDPEQAINFAISITPPDHAVLWCGPGHLKYREIAGVKVDFDARAIAKTAVEQA